MPADTHGTSLQELNPMDPNPQFLQTGLAIVTPSRLPDVWKKFCKGKLKYADMINSLVKASESHSQREEESDTMAGSAMG